MVLVNNKNPGSSFISLFKAALTTINKLRNSCWSFQRGRKRFFHHVPLNKSTIPFICDVVDLHRCVWKEQLLMSSWRNFVPTQPTAFPSSPCKANTPVTLSLIRGWPVGGSRAFFPSAGMFCSISDSHRLFVFFFFFVNLSPLYSASSSIRWVEDYGCYPQHHAAGLGCFAHRRS